MYTLKNKPTINQFNCPPIEEGSNTKNIELIIILISLSRNITLLRLIFLKSDGQFVPILI